MKSRELRGILPKNYKNVAKTYAEVFAGEPWREVSRCDKCGEFSATTVADKAKCCCGGVFSEEAYPLEETTCYVAKELSKPAAVGLLLARLNTLQVDGFGWGYSLSGKDLASQKYKTGEMQAMLAKLLVNMNAAYYVSEIGVLPAAQGKGYGKALTNGVVDAAIGNGFSEFLVRTNEDSPMRYILQKMGIRAILGLDSGLKDTENEARVIFTGKK